MLLRLVALHFSDLLELLEFRHSCINQLCPVQPSTSPLPLTVQHLKA